MAFISGTISASPPATYGHEELLDQLITFLTTNTDLTSQSPSQAWTVLADNAAAIDEDREVYLRGPGLSDTDTIHVNIRRYTISTGTAPVYNWELRGASGYDSLAAFDAQPGISRRNDFVLFDGDMPYWMFASGRRFIVACRVTNYHSNIYCGLYLPYGTASEVPYPIAILGSTDRRERSYLEPASDVSGFFTPRTSRSLSDNLDAPGTIRRVDGTWVGVLNEEATDNIRLGAIWPWYNANTLGVRGTVDGNFALFPAVLTIKHENVASSDGDSYGELDGVYWVSGGPYTQVEDQIQIGADTYRIIGDGNRFDLNDFAAVKEA